MKKKLDQIKLSKFLSFILRHKPDYIDLELDQQGWAIIDDLIAKSNASGRVFTKNDLLLVVKKNNKKRFSLSKDGLKIRAAQGHSLQINLKLKSIEPPRILYHGTATKNVDAIFSSGIKPQSRRQVHLSADIATAKIVGQRHGTPVVLEIDALKMHQQGFEFYRSDNEVWLTDFIPVEFIRKPLN